MQQLQKHTYTYYNSVLTLGWHYLKGMFCHSEDFNALNLYLQISGVELGRAFRATLDSLMKLLKKKSYFLCTIIPCVCVLFSCSQNSCCTSKTQCVTHLGILGGIKRGILWRMRRDYFMSLKYNILMENYHIKCSMNFHKHNIILVITTQTKK